MKVPLFYTVQCNASQGEVDMGITAGDEFIMMYEFYTVSVHTAASPSAPERLPKAQSDKPCAGP